MAVATQADFFLLPLDPTRGLTRIREELDRRTEADPKIGDARAQVEAALRAAPSREDLDQTLAPLVWLQARDHVRSQREVEAVLRALDDGDAVLRAVEEAVPTVLDPTTLRVVAQEAKQLAGTDSPGAARLTEAHDELRRASGHGDGEEIIAEIVEAVIIAVVIVVIIAGSL